MKKSSVIRILSTFNEQEIKEFRDFVNSPFFNKRQNVTKLFEFLYKKYPFNSEDEISKEKAFGSVFPGKEFNDVNLRVTVHHLIALVEEYLTFCSFKNAKFDKSYHYISAMFDKGEHKLLESEMKKAYSNIETADINSDERYFLRYRFNYEEMFFKSQSLAGIYEKMLNELDFDRLYKNLSGFYYIRLMKLYINLQNLAIIYNKNFNSAPFSEALNKLPKSFYKSIPEAEIFYLLIQMNSSSDGEQYFISAKKWIHKNLFSFNQDDLLEIFINLENFCQRTIRAGNEDYVKELLSIYKQEIEQKLYLRDKFMGPAFYKNVVLTGLRSNDISWTQSFIENYKKELPVMYRENMYRFAKAQMAFKQNNYDDAFSLLSQVKFNELYLKLESKILQMQLYYETDSIESLLAAIDAYRHFLLNNVLIPEPKRIFYSGFAKYLRKIISVKEDPSKDAYVLKKQAEKEKTFSSKQWIMEKIKELEAVTNKLTA